jgi:hypothetical protein
VRPELAIQTLKLVVHELGCSVSVRKDAMPEECSREGTLNAAHMGARLYDAALPRC